MDPQDDEHLMRAFREAGQGHVFRWWEEIGEGGRRKLRDQLRGIDLEHLQFLIAEARAGRLTLALEGRPEPPPYIPLPRTQSEERDRETAAAAGADLLRAGKVCALTVAGGQGTRLGFDGPKGCLPIGPVSGKSIFRIHAERILAARRRYGAPIPWYIMTSRANHAQTRRYFEENAYLGLPDRDVSFFNQRMMPAVDRSFRLVMVAKDEVLLSPNGHGGVLLALLETGMLEDMERRGIEEISYFQVDNPLVPALDPVFAGCHRRAGAEMSSKAIWKRDPEEPLGAFVKVGRRLAVAEYSDLSREEKYRRTADGRLLYGLGSPAIHMLKVSFVRRETESGFRLPFHLAQKRSPYLNQAGELVEPEGKNVYKFETFIFDALRDAERSIILEVRREEEFSPVKNASGPDSPETCRRDMARLYASWLESAGVEVPRDDRGDPVHPIEISPLFALDREELAARLPRGLNLDGPLYLGPEHR